MIFLKLGGSLITKKEEPETVRQQTLERLCEEIAVYRSSSPVTPLLIGHGSGSFGHVAAARFSTHQGAGSSEDWIGFARVWAAAQRLNRLVVDALRACDLAVIAFPPSASALAQDGRIVDMAIEPIKRALDAGLIPLVLGDVAFDSTQGAAIVSTEEVFRFLAEHLVPERVLLAGTEAGVYADYPDRQQLLPSVSPDSLPSLALAGAEAPDVTGGMAAKVRQAFEMVGGSPGLELRIFSGEEPGNVARALRGEPVGTRVLGTQPKVQ